MNATTSQRLESTSTLMFVLAALVGFGGIITGIALATHSVSDCSASAYVCDRTRSPFVGLGWGIVAAGIVQAVVIYAIGHIAHGVALLHPVSGSPSSSAEPGALPPVGGSTRVPERFGSSEAPPYIPPM